MGAPKSSLRDAFLLYLKDYDWYSNGADITNVAADWEEKMADELLWIVRNRQEHVDSYRAEIL